MKLAILADIHGNYEALKYVMLDIKKNDIDKVIFLGDLVMKGPNPKEVYESLKKITPICWLRGNTDLWLSEKRTGNESSSSTIKEIEIYREFALKRLSKNDIDFLLNCPEKQSVAIGNLKMLFVHGSPRSSIEALKPSSNLREALKDVEEEIVFCGHSHIPFIEKVGAKILFNPGSVGCSYDGDTRASYGIMSINFDEIDFYIQKVSYPIENLIFSAETEKFPYLGTYEQLIKKGKKV